MNSRHEKSLANSTHMNPSRELKRKSDSYLLNLPMDFTTFHLLMSCQTIEIHIFAMRRSWENSIKFESVLGAQDQVGFIFAGFADAFLFFLLNSAC